MIPDSRSPSHAHIGPSKTSLTDIWKANEGYNTERYSYTLDGKYRHEYKSSFADGIYNNYMIFL